jgi:thiol-disulfide isomerase/thioredoxin
MEETQTPQPARPTKGMGTQAKIAVGVVAIVALTALFWPRGTTTSEAPGGFLLDHAGRATTLGSRLGPVTLLHFWASWCPPCLTEIPALQRLSAEYASDMDFRVVMVAVADPVDKVDGLMGASAERVLFDPNWDVAHRYGTNQLPESYLLVGTHVVEKFIGATNWDDPAIRARLRHALEAARAGKSVG